MTSLAHRAMAAACMIALPDPAGPQAQALARALGVTITLADVLHRRGRGDDDETRRFLETVTQPFMTKPFLAYDFADKVDELFSAGA